MNRLRKIGLSSLFTAVTVPAILALQAGQRAPDFQLADQFNKTWKLPDLKGRVVVVVAADRNSGEAMGPWVDKIKARYAGKVQLLGLLDLHDVPRLGRGMAKSRVKKETNDPMMLDFQGRTARNYEANSSYPVTTVLDKSGRMKAVQKTKYTPNAYRSITAAIDAAINAR